MASTVTTITLQEIGHNSGDVLSEQTVRCYEFSALMAAREPFAARNPDWPEGKLWRAAGLYLTLLTRRPTATS